MNQKILPSVMAKSQQQLDALFKKLNGVAKHLHLDIADGKFVPNRSLHFPFRLSSKFKYNAHLMIKHPEKWIKKHGRKVDLCIVHFEAIKNPRKYIKSIKKVAFAINPETKVSKIKPYLKDVDYVLIMTVHPGFYGARYLKSPLKKIKEIKKINPKIKIIVDGGMKPKTIKGASKAGADFFVSGSFVSKSEHPRKAMAELRNKLRVRKGFIPFSQVLKKLRKTKQDKVLFLQPKKPPKRDKYIPLKEMLVRLRKK